MIERRGVAFLLAALGAVGSWPAAAQISLAERESFRIGSEGVLCTAQALTADPALRDMFDRGYSIVCRDAAAPVGRLYALRIRGPSPLGRLEAIRAGSATCPALAAPARSQIVEIECRLNDGAAGYRVLIRQRGNRLFVAEGLAGYDSALRLGLQSLVGDRQVAGTIEAGATGADDPAAFARAQAGTLDPERALAEAYRRNNAGAYAEAAEFFTAVMARETGSSAQAEALANQALQRSNLGGLSEADALFARAERLAGEDFVLARRLRNYRAMHLLNQGRTAEALAVLDRPVPTVSGGGMERLLIDRATSIRLSAEAGNSGRLGGIEGLTREDRARVLDGQALQLRGTVLRLEGRDAEAAAPLTRALNELVAIRAGRIAATRWMRAQIFAELASLAEGRGDTAEARRLHGLGIRLLEINYPGSPALLVARGRLAAFLARSAAPDEARALYRAIVADVGAGSPASPSLRVVLEPYFALLAGSEDPAAAADLFLVSQLLVRPGVAQTQAVLARELSGGSDEASRLFRESTTLARDVERARIAVARAEANQSAADQASLAQLRADLADVQGAQTQAQSRLAAFPRYRAVADNGLSLADLQALLGPGEAYYKMLVAGDAAFAIFATADTARAFRIGAGAGEIEREVDSLRSTISVIEDGQQLTYPFDVARARRLYGHLFGPVSDRLGAVTHLIFEPDGAMLRLPINLLVTADDGIEAYRRRAENPDTEFDFRGIAWLGRDRDVSTALSAPAFRDVRGAARSRAASAYLGFGQNQPVSPLRSAAATPGDRCDWPPIVWSRPIAADELHLASRLLAGRAAGASAVVTGREFTDTNIAARDDLDDYRIVHFATHGVVSGPRPDCPPRPGLVTSFGGEGSDGMLSFAEIFDLRLDADLIILSACDTAGHAGRAASAEAGISSGGEFSFDGLVRAFIGAGGRMVVASHWPVPDDYDATARLIGGLFSGESGEGLATSLRAAQRRLMDEADTSHPYYWSAFAVIGDGSMPLAGRNTASAEGH